MLAGYPLKIRKANNAILKPSANTAAAPEPKKDLAAIMAKVREFTLALYSHDALLCLLQRAWFQPRCKKLRRLRHFALDLTELVTLGKGCDCQNWRKG